MPGILRCPHCGTNLRYKTPTPPPRARCPKCDRLFEPEPEVLEALSETPNEPATELAAQGSPTPPAPPLGRSPGPTAWYYARGGTRFGPFTEARMRELGSSGILDPDDFVWNDQLEELGASCRDTPLIYSSPPAAGENCRRNSSSRVCGILAKGRGLSHRLDRNHHSLEHMVCRLSLNR